MNKIKDFALRFIGSLLKSEFSLYQVLILTTASNLLSQNAFGAACACVLLLGAPMACKKAYNVAHARFWKD